jgi:flagellar assembly protein FliH
MSSRVLDEGHGLPVASPMWRRVPRNSEPQPHPPTSAADATIDLERLAQECERRVAEARSAGLREGETAGRRAGASEVQPWIERLTRTIEELAQLRPRLRREAETDVLRLALAIARRVLRREMAIDPEALHGLVLVALEKIAGQEASRVRVHPADAAQVTEGLRKTASGASIQVVPDPAREPGTLIFETERGNLDASIESQLQEIERGLADRLRSHA